MFFREGPPCSPVFFVFKVWLPWQQSAPSSPSWSPWGRRISDCQDMGAVPRAPSPAGSLPPFTDPPTLQCLISSSPPLFVPPHIVPFQGSLGLRTLQALVCHRTGARRARMVPPGRASGWTCRVCCHSTPATSSDCQCLALPEPGASPPQIPALRLHRLHSSGRALASQGLHSCTGLAGWAGPRCQPPRRSGGGVVRTPAPPL